ncbi:AcrR family transcriptional regulator [Arthrobacter globiformis]|nr:AcrR family transcriptional regulator [Arthrobacter globiformis]
MTAVSHAAERKDEGRRPAPEGDASPTRLTRAHSLSELLTEASATVGAHREAVQKRSRSKMEKVLAAAIDLLVEGGPEAVTTTTVAARAGVSVGWLYNFFDGREALLEEILVSCLQGLDNRLDKVNFDLGGPGWKERAEAGVDAHIEFFNETPAFRAIWFSSEFTGRMIRANRMHDNELAAYLARSITDVRPDAPEVPLDVVTQIFVGMLDKGFDLAYRESPDHGNAALLEEMKRSSIEYLATYLP